MTSLDQIIMGAPRARQRGQILVVVAVSMIGLLLTAGLATDAGLIMMRKAQFDRAIDAAALAGAPVASTGASGTATADKRGMQILVANGIGIDPANPNTIGCQAPPSGTWPLVLKSNSQYCGSAFAGNLPGTTDYHVNASWTIPLAFMSIFGGPFSGSRTGGVASVTLYSGAEASYYDTVDVFTLGNDQGLLQSSNLELFGPNSCINNGDAFTPHSYINPSDNYVTNPYYNDINPPGTYTYRIAIPESYTDAGNKLVRVELFDPQTANLTTSGADGKMSLPANVSTSQAYSPTNVELTNLTSAAVTACNGTRESPCLLSVPGEQANLFWYVRMDEIRAPSNNCTGASYTASYTTQTQYRLYYYRQLPSGQLVKTYLAQYTGKDINTSAAATQEAYATALQWVSPVQNSAFVTPDGDTIVATPNNEQMPAFSCDQINNADGTHPTRCTGTPQEVSSLAEPRVQVDPVPCTAAYQAKYGILCPAGSSNASANAYSNGDFIINVSNGTTVTDTSGTQKYQDGSETDGIYQDPASHTEYVYLEVAGMTGSSENNWGVWAGPALEENPTDTSRQAPSFINARQVYLYNQNSTQKIHTSDGVVAYGVGHLPYNSDTSARTRFPIANVGPELAGAQMKVRLFDADAGTYPPVMFYYDTIPTATWSACWEDNDTSVNNPANHSPSTTCANEGAAAWNVTIPSPENSSGQHQFGQACSNTFTSCGQWADFSFYNPTDTDPLFTHGPAIPFYGGRLFVDYQGGNNDTFGWEITVQARPALVN